MKDIILITGGSSSYGKAAAKLFTENGHTVIITGRNEETLAKAAKETGAVPFKADVTSAADWEKLYDFVKEKYGRLDMLLNNAGG
nr:SDR family NAD(P)-dependent oxidoreductase [Clostridia bacterium]